ncbi:hypothetical protein ACFL6I_11160, partial [candidate division KSB1 bacterium]
FSRKRRRVIRKPEIDVEELSDLIQSLQDEPVMQCAVIEQNAFDISAYGTDELIDYALNILSDNSHYRGITAMTYDKKFVERVKKLPDEKRIGLASHIIENHKYHQKTALEILEGIAGEAEKGMIRAVVSNSEFYCEFPIAAVKAAASIEDYELAAKKFVYLRKEWGYSGKNQEIREFKESIVGDMERYDKMNSLIYEAGEAGNKEEEESLKKEQRENWKNIITGFNDLLRTMDNPEKAFEAVGEAFMEYEERVSTDEYRKGDYNLAIEYFILSRNVSKIFDAAQKANGTKETPGVYTDSVAAFKGFKALLTDFYHSPEMNDGLREKVIEELKETFRPYWAYSNSPALAIEAAEITGDYSALKDNFLHSPKRNSTPKAEVYKFLKEKGVISDDEIVKYVESYLSEQLEKKDPKFKRALEMADLVETQAVDRDLIAKMINHTGLGSARMWGDNAGSAFEYLKERGLITPGEKRVYESMQAR